MIPHRVMSLLAVVLTTLTLVPPTATLQARDNSLADGTQQSNTQILSSPNILEILTIPTDGNLVTTNTTLASGTQYTVRLSGTWVWGHCDSTYCSAGGPDYLRWGDAGYLTDDHWTGFNSDWSSIVYLLINGSQANVGSYSSDHIYRIQIIGSGSPINFSIQDCSGCYSDNAGSLRMELIQGSDTGGTSLNIKSFQQRSMQTSSPYLGGWGSEPYGDPNGVQSTIEELGCFLTSWAMALDSWGAQYGFHTNPHELNQWLRTHKGYDGLYVIPARVAQYARERTGHPYVYLGDQGPDNQKLHNLLLAGTPVILEVNNAGHYVLAVGETTSVGGTSTWYINDPYYTVLYNLDPTLASSYGNNYTRMQWGGELTGPSQLASISFIIASPAELLVTDPQGHRTGVDPRTGITYNEIPGAFYSVQAINSTDGSGETSHPVKELYSSAPLSGDYKIQVIGTGNGSYALEALTYNTVGNPSYDAKVSGQIEVNSVDAYPMSYSSTPGGKTGLQLKVYLPLVVRGP